MLPWHSISTVLATSILKHKIICIVFFWIRILFYPVKLHGGGKLAGPSKSTSSKKWWVSYTTFLEGGTFCWDGTLAINMNVLHLISAVELRTAPGSRREVSHNLPLHVTHRTILNSELLIGLNFYLEVFSVSYLGTSSLFHATFFKFSSSVLTRVILQLWKKAQALCECLI
jgi:hypothetical protein